MRLRLLKKWRCYAIGTILEIFDTTAKEMLRDKIAERYSGPYPPTEKMKTNFFKPK